MAGSADNLCVTQELEYKVALSYISLLLTAAQAGRVRISSCAARDHSGLCFDWYVCICSKCGGQDRTRGDEETERERQAEEEERQAALTVRGTLGGLYLYARLEYYCQEREKKKRDREGIE